MAVRSKVTNFVNVNLTLCCIRRRKEQLLKVFAGTDVLNMIEMVMCSARRHLMRLMKGKMNTS
jgi:hypothetical protein